MVVLATIVLPNFPALSTSQLDNTNLPLTYPVRVINTEQVCPPYEEQVSEQSKIVQVLQDLVRTTIVPSLCRMFQTQSSPAPAVPLATTRSEGAVELQCRSTVTWTECVTAISLEDGHVLPTLT